MELLQNQVLQAMEERRSVRKYTDRPVPREVIQQIITAGTYAASGMGKQSPVILAVTDRALRDRLSELNREVGGWQPGFDPFYGAPAVLVVLADRTIPTHVYDGSLVMGNLMLAAHALGVGSCWIHRAREVFDSPEGKAILAAHGIQGDLEGVGHCVLGYPDGPVQAAPPRREGRVFWAE